MAAPPFYLGQLVVTPAAEIATESYRRRRSWTAAIMI
jgi:hypothetical protein